MIPEIVREGKQVYRESSNHLIWNLTEKKLELLGEREMHISLWVSTEAGTDSKRKRSWNIPNRLVKKIHIHPGIPILASLSTQCLSLITNILHCQSISWPCLFPSGSVPQHLPQGLCNRVKMVSHPSCLNFYTSVREQLQSLPVEIPTVSFVNVESKTSAGNDWKRIVKRALNARL